MKKLLFLLPAALCINLPALTQNKPCKEIIAYYPDWLVKERGNLLAPKNIPYSKYTIINFCFFDPKADGAIKEADLPADEVILLGELTKTKPAIHIPNTGLIELAHKNGVKVMFSVGGWVWSTTFPAIAADPAKRALFAGECARIITRYQFDGVDIDWEYPCYAEHLGTPSDKQNFTLFLAQIRDSLSALTHKTGKPYLVSACFGAGAAKIHQIEWEKVSKLLDMINVMTYDYYDSSNKTTNHNSPLYAPEQGEADYNIDATFRLINGTYHVPAAKINLGLAFYGHAHLGATQLFGASKNCADSITFPEKDGGTSYYNIITNKNKFKEYWDAKAQVPYLLGINGLNTFVSYDNKKSVALKAAYVKRVNAKGLIIWEIGGDYITSETGKKDENGNPIYKITETPLVDTVNAVFCTKP